MALHVGFFTNVVALNNEKHKNLKISREVNYAFSVKSHAIPAVVVEVPYLAKEYPVVFAKGEDNQYTLLAVLGFEEKSNAYVSADGDWLAEYVPAHIRRYPFISLPTTEDPEKSVLCIDQDAPHFQTNKGKKLFDKQGNTTKATQMALRMNEEYEQSMAETNRFIKDIIAQNILEETTENSEFGNITFYRIAVDKFNALDTNVIGKWKQDNYLSVIAFLLQSQRNWREIEIRLRFKENSKEILQGNG